MAQYAAPPIVDAVIELRFDSPLSDHDKAELSKKLSPEYPLVESRELRQYKFDIATGVMDQSTQERIEKRSSAENPRGVQIGTHIFCVFSGAPYEGWDGLSNRLTNTLKLAKKHWGFRKIVRVGVRYINRLDLAENREGQVDYEDYLNLRINLPEAFPAISGYELGFEVSLEQYGCQARIQSKVAEPSVPNRHSFILDVDVWKDDKIPQKEAALYELLGSMREAKNMLFETFITDQARLSFNAD